MALPAETKNAYPHSGSGSPPSPEDEAGYMQILLGSLNGLLGTIGLVFFGIHIFNFLANVQNCPIKNVVSPCVNGIDCTSMAKTSWFQYHLTSNYLRTPEEIAQDSVIPTIPINLIGIWLAQDTVQQTKALVRNISQRACEWRMKELIESPNETLTGPHHDSIGTENARMYMAKYKDFGYEVKWDAGKLHCQDCVKASILMYYMNIDNLIEMLEIVILAVTAYVSALVYNMTNKTLTNCPMIDVAFENDPGSKEDIDVEYVEKQCLKMVGQVFFFRYTFIGVPKHIETLEDRLVQKNEAR